MKPHNIAKTAACVLLACLGGTRDARASGGVEQARFGSEDGHAAGATPFALYYNPAALALGARLEIGAHLTLAWHGASYDRTSTTVPDPATAPGANVGTARVSDVLAAPALALSYRLSDFVIAAGAYVPFAGMQSWSGGGHSYPQYPGTSDGSARWHFLEGGTTSFYASLGASYTIRPIRLSLGVSANLVHNSLEFTRALNAAGDDNIATEGRSYLDVGSFTGSFGLGVLWEAVEKKAWVGLSYQAPPGLYKDISMDGTARILLGAGVTPTESDVTLKQTMPDIIRFALRVRPTERYELRLTGDFTRWSVNERQCLVHRGGNCGLNPDGSLTEGSDVMLNQPRNWQDTFGIRLGGSYFFSPMWEGFASIGYDSNAIPAGTLDASLVDGHDLTYTLGGRARIQDRFGVLLAVSYQHWLERDTTGLSRLDQYRPPSKLPSSDGVYNQQAVVMNLLLQYHLR
ncbi:MAG TPA: outer membrane protein transport protein [Polyangiales bacterium]